jgi:2'-5' RNA ligase
MRLFVALDLPWILRETLSGLCGGLAGARWVAPENLHLTLRFIGETRRDVAEEVDLALHALRCRRFEVALSGTGIFDRNGRTSVLWAGIARNERLEHLQNKIETALQRAGLPPERRRFQPHISLARVDNVAEPLLAGWVQSHNLLRTAPVPIDSFTLFSSQPGPDQPVYTAEVDYELA